MYNNGFNKTIEHISNNKNYRPTYGGGASGGKWYIDNFRELLALKDNKARIINKNRYWPNYGLKKNM